MATRITDFVSDDIIRKLKTTTPNRLEHEGVAKAAEVLAAAVGKIELYGDWANFLACFENIQTEYPGTFSHRTDYFWKWIQVAFQIQTFRIPSEHFIASNSLKCRSAAIAIILDDICDNANDQALFESCLDSLRGVNTKSPTDLHTMLQQNWAAVREALALSPNYALLRNDIEQAYGMLVDGFRYGLAVLEKQCTPLDGSDLLENIAHTTHVYLAGLIDLLFVPGLRFHQIENCKRVFIATQKMAQIGNWVATWEREIKQGDFTSGVAWLAREKGLIDASEGNLDILIQRIKQSGIERHFLEQWDVLRQACYQIGEQNNNLFTKDYVDGFSIILAMQLAGRGLI